MRIISAEAIDASLTFPKLIGALRKAFAAEITVPVRHHHTIPRPGGHDATTLLMPAWSHASPRMLGVKIVNVFPDNGLSGLPAVHGTYLLMSGDTGETLAAMDGSRLTLWRTAAASALAASCLADPDAESLLMVGAGALAPFLIRAHLSVRPIRSVRLWNHRAERAEALMRRLRGEGLPVEAVTDLQAAARSADIISCATLSTTPLIQGDWLKQNAHLDLVGGFTPRMREADDAAVRRCRVYVDTRAGAMTEAGDIVQPLTAGTIDARDVLADLHDLCRGNGAVLPRDGRPTLFKSVGTALEDLAAAELIWMSAAPG